MHGKVKIAAVGLGNRTCKYLRYVEEHGESAELVAVVDPDPSKADWAREAFSLSTERCRQMCQMCFGTKLSIFGSRPVSAQKGYTVIECEKAVIAGDESFIDVTYKDSSVPQEKYDFLWTRGMELHAGADHQGVKEFIDSIASGDLQTRTPSSEALASHLICFRAEKSAEK